MLLFLVCLQYKSNVMQSAIMSVTSFKLNTNPINEETREVAERELNETPERSASAIAELKRLLQVNTDLHYYDDDEFLLTFLRPCHFYPESALNLVSITSSTILYLKTGYIDLWILLCLFIPIVDYNSLQNEKHIILFCFFFYCLAL